MSAVVVAVWSEGHLLGEKWINDVSREVLSNVCPVRTAIASVNADALPQELLNGRNEGVVRG